MDRNTVAAPAAESGDSLTQCVVMLRSSQRARLQQVADERYEGNLSMAVRRVIDCGLQVTESEAA